MLELDNLNVNFGKIKAVCDVCLKISRGEIITITGPNGAGKSSTLNAITGIIRPVKGSINFRGEEIAGQTSEKIIKKGIVQIPEGRKIFGTLTVRENIIIGAYRKLPFTLYNQNIKSVLNLFPSLENRLDENASNLSGGQAQLLALARGLMAEPDLLLLDEPTLGLSPIPAMEIFKLLKWLKSAGMTIILVEQNIHKTLAISDRIYILESGKVILKGRPDKIKSAPEFLQYAGDYSV